jgi:hypothetical protein
MEFKRLGLPDIPNYCPRCKKLNSHAIPFCKCGFDLQYGSVERRNRGVCIYCPHKGRIVLSEEHIHGKWLAKKFAKDSSIKTHHTLVRPEVLSFDIWPTTQHSVEVKKRHPYYSTVWNVCKECNNGWMSKTHTEAKTIISKLAMGNWPQITKAEQLALSRWVAMVTINLEYFSHQPVTVQSQRDALKRGEVPEAWRISLLRTKGEKSGGNHFQRKIALSELDYSGNYIKVQSTFFCVENVAFHSINSKEKFGLSLYESVMPSIFNQRVIWPSLHARRVGRAKYYTGRDIWNLQNAFTLR